jgi:Uma2 family endonuclease
MTFEEFLTWEQGQESRWEFVNGEVFAMAGGTAGHERVARALTRLIERSLPAGCEVFART